MLPMTSFEFKWPWRLCLAFPGSGFNFITQTLAKTTRKCPCQRFGTLAFELKVASKPYSKILPYLLKNLRHFFSKWFQLRQSKTCKKQIILKPQQYLFLSSRKLEKPFIRRLLWRRRLQKLISKKLPVTKFWFK